MCQPPNRQKSWLSAFFASRKHAEPIVTLLGSATAPAIEREEQDTSGGKKRNGSPGTCESPAVTKCLVDEVGFSSPPPQRKRLRLSRMLPVGCIDVYNQPLLADWCPLMNDDKSVDRSRDALVAMPLEHATESIREEAEHILHQAFKYNACHALITHMLGLQQKVVKMRSGRSLPRIDSKLDSDQHWIFMQWKNGKIVAAALLRRQGQTKTGQFPHPALASNPGASTSASSSFQGPESLYGGMVLEYIASHHALGGKAKLLVAAVLEVCRREGSAELFSACDLAQTGRAFGGSISALKAHEKWGFKPIDSKEWTYKRLEGYSANSHVQFMRREVNKPIL